MDDIDRTFEKLKKASFESLVHLARPFEGNGKYVLRSDFESTGWTTDEFIEEYRKRNRIK